MTEGLKWTVNEVPKSDDKHLELMSEENVKKANEFHRSFPQYSVTPLQNLSSLAKYLGVATIVISEAMGHTSEDTTQIYLGRINNTVLDEANNTVVAVINDKNRC